MLVRLVFVLLNLLHTVVCNGASDQVNTGLVRIVLGCFGLFVVLIIGVHCCLKRQERIKFDKGKSCTRVFKENKDREKKNSQINFHEIDMDKNLI